MSSDLQNFLTKKQQKTNQNTKFPDSSPTASVFNRLEYNFTPVDTSILEISDEVKDNLKKTPKQLKDWQADDMASNVIRRSTYFKNPVGNRLERIINLTKLIYSYNQLAKWREIGGIWQITFPLQSVATLSDEVSVVTAEQLAHTNRLSNLVEITEETAELPHYEQVIPVGRQLSYILYQTDDIQNTSPVLGCLTSLFFDDEYARVEAIMASIEKTISDSLINYTVSDPELGTIEVWTTTLTDEEIQIEVDKMTGANESNGQNIGFRTRQRRLHDENFWTNTQKILEEYQFVRSLNDGAFQQKMLNEVVGTEALKQRLKTKDVPVQPAYNVVVNYDGTIQYLPREPNTNTISYPYFELRTRPIQIEVD